MPIPETDISLIKEFHAHLYYDVERLPLAGSLRTRVQEKFGIFVGTLHERNVGPHLTWSCQLTVPVELFTPVITWLALNRGAVDVFVHPDTGNDLLDHTAYVMWLGRSYDLKTDMF